MKHIMILFLCATLRHSNSPSKYIALEKKSHMIQSGPARSRARQKLPPNWKGLIPLQTNRSEAEKVLGVPKSFSDSQFIYELEGDRVDVWYSLGKCGQGLDTWKVGPDVILQLAVVPGRTVLLKDLVFDRSKYGRRKWPHPKNWVTYTNVKDGIWIETTDFGGGIEEVRSIKYVPKKVDDNLKCDK